MSFLYQLCSFLSKKAIFGFLLASITGSIGAVSENSLSLVEAFLRTGNYSQALRLTQSFPQKTALSGLFEGIALIGAGRETDGLQLIEKSWSRANEEQQKRFLQSLQNYLRNQTQASELVLVFWEQYKPFMKSDALWRSIVIRALYDKKYYDAVLQFETPLDRVEILQSKADAALALGKMEELLKLWVNEKFEDEQIHGEYIRILVRSGYKKEALKEFQKIASMEVKWVATLQLELGGTLDKPELQKEGYEKLIRLNPLDFEPYRGLASLLFQLKEDRKAEATLLDYLKAHPRKYNGAREIAQVLVDHGRFYSLMEFLKQVRKQWKNPLAFHDVALFAYSHRKDFNGFFQELEKMYPQILGRSWGRKIVDSFMIEQLPQVFAALKAFRELTTDVQTKILSSFYEYSKTDPGDWVKDALSDLPQEDLLERARYFYRQTRFEIVPKLLDKTYRKGARGELALLLGKAYYRLGMFGFSYPVLQPLLKTEFNDLELLSQVLDMCARDLTFRQDLNQIVKSLKDWESEGAPLPPHLKQSMAFLTYEQGLLTAAEVSTQPPNLSSEDHQYLSILQALSSGQIEDSLEKMKTFLHNQLSSFHFPAIQALYLKALDFKGLFPDSGAGAMKALLLLNSGELSRFADEFTELEAEHEGNPGFAFLGDMQLFARSLQIRRNLDIPDEGQSSKQRLELLEEYESIAWKLIEEFNQSLYTPAVIENLIEELSHEGLHTKKEKALKKILLKRSSDLLAQKLRNKLL